MRKSTKIAKNSSYITARALLLDALRRRHRRWTGSITLMGVAAAATAGSLCPSTTALRLVDQGQNRYLFQHVGDVGQPPSGHAAAQIAVGPVPVEPVHAGTDAAQARLIASAELPVVPEFIAKLANHVRTLESAEFVRPPSGELDPRMQVEVHGARALPRRGLIRGIRSIGVATALATIAVQVDSALASRGRLVSLIATDDEAWLPSAHRGLGTSRGRRTEREDRWAGAPLS